MDAVRKKSGPAAAHQKDTQPQQAERGCSRFRNGAQGIFPHLLFRQNGRVQVKIIQGIFSRDSVRGAPCVSGGVFGGKIDLGHVLAAEGGSAAEVAQRGQRERVIPQHGGDGNSSPAECVKQSQGGAGGITGKRLRFPGGGGSSPSAISKTSGAQGEISGLRKLESQPFQILVRAGVVGKQQTYI